MQPVITYLLWYLAAVNLVTFTVYGVDKAKARRGAWRVPEKTLFLLPLLGGSVGALLGQAGNLVAGTTGILFMHLEFLQIDFVTHKCFP